MSKQVNPRTFRASYFVRGLLFCGLFVLGRTPAPASPTEYPLSIQDGLGKSLKIERRPQKIASLAPSLTESIFAINAGSLLIADSEYCNYPDAAKSLPKLGRMDVPNTEVLFKLHPDLVFATPITPIAALQQIEKLGIPVCVLTHDKIEGTLADIGKLGLILDQESEAQKLVDSLTAALAEIRKKADAKPRPRTLLLYGANALFSTGKNTFAGQLIELAGGDNIAANTSSDWPQLSMEKILTANPQVILITTEKAESGINKPLLDQWKKNPLWSRIYAVQSGRIYHVPNDPLSVPGPRLAQAAESIFQVLHSDNKEDSNSK